MTMNKYLIKYLLSAGLLLVTMVPQMTLAGEKNNLVSLGGWAAASYGGTMGSIAYERMFNNAFAVGGRISHYSYDCTPCGSWSSTYHEKGSGNLAEVTLTYHFFREGFNGPFIGPSFGSVSGDWSWTDPATFPSAGSGSTSAVSYSVVFGWDFALASDNIVIRPAIFVGSWGGSSTDNTGLHSSSLGTIAAAGISAGFAF
jgi:hypothetical protein